ncbi:MAG TPA: beta-ketoacyl synthase N-terminal-like domain-containing protein [Tepidisphaeraceae bacterium]|nr:beta-ketoacyl synthase N-terminal-like domain-containing protein [Tepidisphaeraceae bacterium]
MRRVVITGIGVISPIGIGARTFWDNLVAGKVGVRRISNWDPSGFPSQVGGEVPPYKIGDYVPKSYRKATKVMARDIELAVIAADDAFKDANLKSKAYAEKPEIPTTRFGCNIGAGLINVDLNELTAALATSRAGDKLDLKRWGSDGINNLTPLWLLKYLPNMLACHVTIVHELKGPSNTITCADASSHLAIGEAFRTIQRGAAELAICGGAETKVLPMSVMRQVLLRRATETHNDSPEQAVRPFDADADGTAVGEGGGLFILEEYEHAKKRGAKIYAELVGFGASQDTYSVTEPDPQGVSYGKAVSKALADANLPPNAVDLMVPCGLGIPGHDRAELAGLHNVFGGGLERVAMAPTKAQTGNLAAGSGVDAAAAVLALHHNTIPPAVNTRKPLDGVKLNVRPESRDARINVSVSTVYSLGGQNAALVFKKVPL